MKTRRLIPLFGLFVVLGAGITAHLSRSPNNITDVRDNGGGIAGNSQQTKKAQFSAGFSDSIILKDGTKCVLRPMSQILYDGFYFPSNTHGQWDWDCAAPAKQPEHGTLLGEHSDALALLVDCGEDGIIVCSVTKPASCVCPAKKKPPQTPPTPRKSVPA